MGRFDVRRHDMAIKNFLGLNAQEANLKHASWVVLPAPYERTTTYVRGCRHGPVAIIHASEQVELYDERLGRESYRELGVHTAPVVRCSSVPAKQGLRRIQARVAAYLAMGKKVALLGGEHTVTLASAWAHREKGRAFTVLSLDAHADLRESYQGSPLNHACVARRLLEVAPVVVAGVRNISAGEAGVVEEKKLPVFFAHEGRLDRPGVMTRVMRAIKTEAVYLSLDLDVFDPSLISAVGTPEPGGAAYNEVVAFLELLCRRKRVIGFDVVELCPRSGEVVSDFTAAKLVYHLIGLIG